MQKMQKDFEESGEMDESKETEPFRYNRTDSHMNLQRQWQHPHGLYGFRPDGVSVLREENGQGLPPPLTMKLSAMYNPWQRRK